MKRFLKEYGLIGFVIIIFFFLWVMVDPPQQKRASLFINATELREDNRRLNQTVDLLIKELYEEKHMRTICEEAVGRWANDARTRQEVKNEARRLKERAKKKGAKK